MQFQDPQTIRKMRPFWRAGKIANARMNTGQIASPICKIRPKFFPEVFAIPSPRCFIHEIASLQASDLISARIPRKCDKFVHLSAPGSQGGRFTPGGRMPTTAHLFSAHPLATILHQPASKFAERYGRLRRPARAAPCPSFWLVFTPSGPLCGMLSGLVTLSSFLKSSANAQKTLPVTQ